MHKRFGDSVGRAKCLHDVAWLLLPNDQLGAVQGVTLRTIVFIPENRKV